MGLIEDLLGNNYLITPSAFFLLREHYPEKFTLAQLIKFVKSKGAFVVDLEIAEEFLSTLGLVTEVPLATSAGKSDESGESISHEDASLSSLEHEEVENEILANPIDSTAENEAEIESSSEVLDSYVSTGEAPYNEAPDIPVFENRGEKANFSEGESFVSTGASEAETSETPEVDFENGYGGFEDNAVDETMTPPDQEIEDSESSGEYNGENGGIPKVLYDEYGVPVGYVEEEVLEEKSYSTYSDVVITPKPGFSYRAASIEGDWALIFDVKNVKFTPPKVKNASGKEGELIVKVYSNYFKSRLKKMRKILRENPEVGGVIDIAKLSYVNSDEDVTIIGIVDSKRETRKGYMFEVEDGSGTIKVFVNRENEESKKFFQIMPDSVVAFRGRYSGRNIFFADKIFLPDVPKFKREKPPLEEKVYAILLSDIHVGSNKFCEKAFERFLEWLNGEVANKREEEFVSRVKYLVIAGDVVDGIGIYPGQYNELEIPDIFDQYEALANLLRNVPDHITMFIGPGNHDAARTAIPQPGFYEEYAKPLYKLKNAVIISNPAVLRLHGRDFLIAHGRGIEDVVSFIPNRSHHRPAEAMVDLLKLRHLAPTFGGKVPIAPDPEDTLVIESVPDLFQAGHVHVMDYRIYNGVFVINTGTWQAQTEFQKMVNIVPTPARVPIIDVETARLRAVVRFDQFCEGV